MCNEPKITRHVKRAFWTSPYDATHVFMCMGLNHYWDYDWSYFCVRQVWVYEIIGECVWPTESLHIARLENSSLYFGQMTSVRFESLYPFLHPENYCMCSYMHRNTMDLTNVQVVGIYAYLLKCKGLPLYIYLYVFVNMCYIYCNILEYICLYLFGENCIYRKLYYMSTPPCPPMDVELNLRWRLYTDA